VSISASLVSRIHQQSRSYVAKLLKIRDAFINPLLHHPFANTSSTTMPGHDGNSTVESLGHLAIASRLFYSPTAGSGDNKNDNGRARTTSHASRWRGQGNLNSDVEHDPHKPLASWTPADSLSPLFPHRSPRLPPHPNHSAVSTAPLGFRSSVEPSSGGVSPHQMPEDLWLCLEGIEGILTDHLKLGEALRKRYNEQYPTVRSLVDILLGNVRLSIFFSHGLDHRLTLAIVTRPPGLYGLCSTPRTGPRASQRCYCDKHFNLK
jgi:hypothetical protein